MSRIERRKRQRKQAVRTLLTIASIGFAVSGTLALAAYAKAERQARVIKKLKTSNERLERSNSVLLSERRRVKKDYDHLSDRYFRAEEAVSRGAERDGLIAYRAHLESYLKARGSPLADYVDTLIMAEKATGIEARLVVGIAIIESMGGVRNANSFNAWGRKAPGGGYQAFPSWPDAIFNQFTYLKRKWNTSDPYRLKGYATDSSWPAKVSGVMKEIGTPR